MHVARMRKRRVAYGVLVGKTEGKRALGRPRSRVKDNIKMESNEIGWEDVDWMGFGNEPSVSTKCSLYTS